MLMKDYKNSKQKEVLQSNLVEMLEFLGILDQNYFNQKPDNNIDEAYILNKIEQRKKAKENKDYCKADAIRDELLKQNIVIKDSEDSTNWERK